MKTPVLFGIVLALHAVAIGSLFFIQGCSTTGGPVAETAVEPAPAPVLPPKPGPVDPVVESNRLSIRPPAPILPPLSSPFERPAGTAPVSDTKVYIVQPGDSVSKIAFRYGLSVREVIELNKMKNANALRVGQKLILPAYADVKPATPTERVQPAPRPVVKPRPAPAPAPAPKPAAAPVASDDVYEVKNGDSLSKIAVKLGVKTADLKSANNLKSDLIRVGQKLKVPGKAASAPAPAVEAAPPAPPAPAPAPIIPPPAPAPMVEPTPAPVAPAPAPAPAVLEPIGLTPPPPPPATPAPAPAPGGATGGGKPFPYPVGEGETIQSIASAFLVSPDALMKLNNITDPNSLKPGQKILIPMPAE